MLLRAVLGLGSRFMLPHLHHQYADAVSLADSIGADNFRDSERDHIAYSDAHANAVADAHELAHYQCDDIVDAHADAVDNIDPDALAVCRAARLHVRRALRRHLPGWILLCRRRIGHAL
jgi:hypothetical protein